MPRAMQRCRYPRESASFELHSRLSDYRGRSMTTKSAIGRPGRFAASFVFPGWRSSRGHPSTHSGSGRPRLAGRTRCLIEPSSDVGGQPHRGTKSRSSPGGSSPEGEPRAKMTGNDNARARAGAYACRQRRAAFGHSVPWLNEQHGDDERHDQASAVRRGRLASQGAAARKTQVARWPACSAD